jgi:hypothetical protein
MPQICADDAGKIGKSGHRVIGKSEPKETPELLFFRYPITGLPMTGSVSIFHVDQKQSAGGGCGCGGGAVTQFKNASNIGD